MKIKNEVLVNSINILSKLNNYELPIKLSYSIAKNIKIIDEELKIYTEERQKLINKYAEKDKDGNIITSEDGTVNILDSENWERDIMELLKIENEINIKKIKIEELENSDIRITPFELTQIEYMIK